MGTFDVVTVPVHPNVRDAACASDDTISSDTSADSSRDVCDPVSKLPLVHARIYLFPFLAPMAWLRQVGDIRLHTGGERADTPAGVCFSGNALPKS